jgi:hypothetical protein
MIVGLSGGVGAAGTGIDPVTGGTIACNPGDTFDPTTAMCYDAAVGVGMNEYYGTLTLPALGSGALTTAVPVVAADWIAADNESPAGCPAGSTCTIISTIPDTTTYIGLAVIGFLLFKGMGN